MSDEENQIIEPAAFQRASAAKKKTVFAPSPMKLGLASVFLLLAMVALFIFSARAVLFEFDPENASMDIIDGWPTWQVGQRYLMLSGDYKLTATAPGYHPLNVDISVGKAADQEIFQRLEKLPGIVSIETVVAAPETFESDTDDSDTANLETAASGTEAIQIEAAEVFIDQTLVGITPITLDAVAAGIRELTIKHPRYLTYQTEIDVAGMREQQNVTVPLDPAWANIGVSTTPPGASIVLDGNTLATTPATLELMEGDHRLQLKLAGYKTFETALDVIAQQDQTLATVSLIKSDGKLNVVSSPEGVNVTISGTYYGQTPISIGLAPGKNYQLEASRAGYKSAIRRFDVEPDEDQRISLRLEPIVGQIRLEVSPANATLLIDDTALGNPNRILELPARAHRLRIELAGYAAFETEVIPQPGLPQQLTIALQTEEEARVSAIPQQVTTSLGDTLRFMLPGTLEMGAGRREPGRRSNEIQKNVELTRAFYLGKKEISNRSFKAFAPGHDSGRFGRALLSEDDRPVVNISWSQAVRFANWLSEKEGLPVAYAQKDGNWRLIVPYTIGYRLPTEAEWAWAARYDNDNEPARFPWGDNMPPPPGAGNFADESAANMAPYIIKGYNDNFRGPAPSGTYDANNAGIFDLAGNVSEWVNDYYSVDLQRELLTDPTGPVRGDYYVIRGSNYTHGRFSELRWTFRDYGSEPRSDVGFRLARFAD